VRVFSRARPTRFTEQRMGMLCYPNAGGAPYRVNLHDRTLLFTRRWQKLTCDSSAATNPPHRLTLMHPLTVWFLHGWPRGRRGHNLDTNCLATHSLSLSADVCDLTSAVQFIRSVLSLFPRIGNSLELFFTPLRLRNQFPVSFRQFLSDYSSGYGGQIPNDVYNSLRLCTTFSINVLRHTL